MKRGGGGEVGKGGGGEEGKGGGGEEGKGGRGVMVLRFALYGH